MKINLIIDGNYILNKNTFALNKMKMLYGELQNSLERSLDTCKSWYHFDNIYLVSDSGKHSWRKKLYPEYKGNRSKSEEIDWEFVFTCYNEFKDTIPPNVELLEEDMVEGDDWISYIVHESNKKGFSNIIVSNDYDLKQLINFSLDKMAINIMTNEMFNREKVFLPQNYSVYISQLRRESKVVDLFNLNDDNEFLNFLNKFIEKREIHESLSVECLITKMISGDKSDNITSAYQSLTKTGKIRGIGEAGAKKLYNKYIEEFGEINLNDDDLLENIADLVREYKKAKYSEMDKIIEKLDLNMKLISLFKLPKNIKNIIKEKVEI